MVGILNYGSGNVAAFANAFRRQGLPHRVVDSSSEISACSHLVLPGVGAFDPVMERLTGSGLLDELRDAVLSKETPVLGVCVGMQILFEHSAEGEAEGLGWLKGSVRKIEPRWLDRPPHLPHMGWSGIRIERENPLFADIDEDRGFYFLHSYYADPGFSEHTLATVNYGEDFSCVVQNRNIFGVQFHPEKSHSNGWRLLRNFAGYSQ